MKRLLLETSFSKIYMLVMIIITLFILGSYFSYAMFTVTKEKSNAISIVTGSLNYKLEVDGSNSNTLTVSPNSSKDFIITLSNPNNRIARFNFYYIGDIPSDVEIGYLNEEGINIPPVETGMNLEKIDTSGSSNTYKIRVNNISSNSVTINLGVSVGLDYNDLELPSNGHLFNEYKDIPNAPELDDGMIAVTYNGSNWVKADTNNTNNDWYNYDEQKWANAVTVSSSTRSTYKNASVGTVVSMNDIETMWAWVPRYSYSIGSEDGTNYYGKKGCYLDTEPKQALPGEIDVRFISNDIKDRGSAKYQTTTGTREYYTPDAFTFGNKELSGIWVGKFETSSSNPSASNGGVNTTSLDAMIKPNVKSWRQININNAFRVSMKMNDYGNRYGFTSKIDTHVMKNSEWAIVAYLSQSKYGKLGNTKNKSNNYITGCSSGTAIAVSTELGCPYTYDIEINGTGASTTGNIYGIYDMSGGSWEYVMGNYNNTIGSGGFSTMPESKFYDKYTSDNILTACNGKECLSHGLSETVGLYNDDHYMVSQQSPWMTRSGVYDNGRSSGVFYFHVYNYSSSGAADLWCSFRLAITSV